MIDASFTKLLMHWHSHFNKREMPWKGEKDPYKVWLSEIILQQTRVDQGWQYYEKIIKAYPNIIALAAADDNAVFKLWEGLGYYSRCRNMLITARYISTELKGHFPNKYSDIIQLKGIGPYTAAAISSFCFNLPHAVVDGNVFRVLSRIGAIDYPIDSTEGKQYFTNYASKLLDKKKPGIYNQAIMDFGATVCTPKQPQCNICTLQKICTAYHANKIDYFPIKEKKLIKTTRHLNYFIIRYNNKILINQRMKKDIWQQLWQFVLYESNESIDWSKQLVIDTIHEQYGIEGCKVNHIMAAEAQQLTHRNIIGFFIDISIPKKIDLPTYEWVTANELKQKPFPRFCNQYIATL